MNNMGGLLQQAQQMQRKMLEIDKKLSEMEVSGEVSNGLVKVIMTGKGVVKSIKIDPCGAILLQSIERKQKSPKIIQ